VSDESNKVADEIVADSAMDAAVEGHKPTDSSESVTDPAVASEAASPEEGAVLSEGPGEGEVPNEDGPDEGQEVMGAGAASIQEDVELEEDSGSKKDWYILKVQSNRERSIADALRRKIAIEGLDDYFGDVIVPTEKVTEFKGGKKKIVERKLYPGYIVVCMCINDDTWFAVRETSGIGDFTGSGGKPTPMLAHEVARIIQTDEEEHDEAPKLDIRFKQGDRVKIKEGTFEGFEGDVSDIDEASGRVTVIINIFSRSTPVELEYWQIESV
jgi:transcriptional antiterminator NusG